MTTLTTECQRILKRFFRKRFCCPLGYHRGRWAWEATGGIDFMCGWGSEETLRCVDCKKELDFR